MILLRRRRVREDVRGEKQRRNPNRAEGWNFRKLGSQTRRANEWRLGGMLVATGTNKRDRADVIGVIRVGVNPLVPTRRDAEQNSTRKSGHRERSSEARSAGPRIHGVRIIEGVLEPRKRHFRRLPS